MNEQGQHAAPTTDLALHPAMDPAANEELYGSIVMLLSEGVVVQDAAGPIVVCNPNAERILGLSREQMLGRTSVDPRWRAIHPDGSPFPGETHPAMIALRTGLPQAGVTMGIHKPDGTLTWIRVDAHPLVHAGETAPHAVVSLFKDITDQIQAERELGESKEHYRTLLTLSPDAISVTDETGTILDCNEQFARMCGYDQPTDVIGRPSAEFVRPEGFARLYREVSTALTSGEGVARGIEIEVLLRDGRSLVTEYSIAQVPWPDAPSGVAYFSVIRDITTRKQMLVALAQHGAHLEGQVQERTLDLQAEIAERARVQTKLQESHENIQALLAAPDDAVMIIDPTGRVRELNERTARILGRSREEMLGRPVYDFMSPQARKLRRARVRAVIKARVPLRFEDEQEGRQVENVVYPVCNAGGEIVRLVVFARDVTEHKRSEEALRESNKRLHELAAHLQEAREEERRRIARELHDELGQQLTALKMDLSLLGRKLESDAADAGGAARELAETRGLVDRSIQSLRQIALDLRPDVFDKLGLIEGLRWQAEEFNKRTGIRCELVLNTAGAALDEPREVALFRIFQEALTNVSRHSGADRVEAALSVKGGWIRLAVRDNGRGITEAEIAGQRSLGLLGMRERAYQLGGELRISAQAGGGTTVEALLPLQKGRELAP